MTIDLTEEQIASILVRDTPIPTTSVVEMTSPEVIVEHVKHLGMLANEHFTVITIGTRNQLLSKHIISVGTLDAALVHPRETFRVAIQDNAAKIVLVHNHPSGNPTPSEDDELITRRLVAAGKILGIQVMDHIIIAGNKFESMLDSGKMARV